MTYNKRAFAFLLVAATCLGQQTLASDDLIFESEVKKSDSKPANRRLLVRYRKDVPIKNRDAAHFSVGAYVVQSFEVPSNLDVVEVAKGISLKAAQEFYEADPNVLYVEPDYPIHALLTPPPKGPKQPPPGGGENDPKLADQWGLNNIGQNGGKVDADINAPEAWEELTGDKNIVIAVIDTGVNYNHPDLKDNMWVNPGEIAGNGIDDDGNGVIDDIHGFNAIANNGDPMDDHGHGSHCSGVIGAKGQNKFGGSGVLQEATIIGCKFLDADGGGETSGAIACLDYLRNLKLRTDNPVNVFASSNSWGSSENSEALKDAIQAHQDEGILFFAAASNDSQDNDVVDNFPSDYPLANVVSVAATDRNDNLAWFSNFGKRTVHLGAPGVEVLSTVLGDEYEEMDGTSMATPFAAGLAGLIKAYDPSLTYIQVKNLLMAGGTPIDALNGKTISGRRIRAYDDNGQGSITCENQIVSGRLSPSSDHLLVAVGETVLLSALNINCAFANGDVFVPMNPGKKKLKLLDNGLGIDSAADDGMYTIEWKAQTPGRYEFVFPGDDVVVITAYDAGNLLPYTSSTESEFNYRNFEGTKLDAEDDWVGTIQLPFSIPFGSDDNVFDTLTIGSNGGLSFTNDGLVDVENHEFPKTNFVSFIAPLWDDLDPNSGDGGIYYGEVGTAPNREFIVEWRDVSHYGEDNGGTFQVVFFEDSSDILFNYLDVDFGTEDFNNGASATVGVQSTATQYSQFSYNSPTLQNNSAIRFSVVE